LAESFPKDIDASFKYTYAEEFQQGVRVDSYQCVIMNFNFSDVQEDGASQALNDMFDHYTDAPILS